MSFCPGITLNCFCFCFAFGEGEGGWALSFYHAFLLHVFPFFNVSEFCCKKYHKLAIQTWAEKTKYKGSW